LASTAIFVKMGVLHKAKGVAFKDSESRDRPARSILTLKPFLTIDPKDKGKGILEEPESAKKITKSDFDAAQIARDEEIARQLKVELQAELEREMQREEQASMDYISNLYDEVQARIDVDHELSVKWTHEEQEKYTVDERATLLAKYFERRKKKLAKERIAAIKNKPPTKTQLRRLMMTYRKNMGRFTHSQLNKKSFEDIQGLYMKEQELIADFAPIGSKEDERMIRDMNKKAKEESSDNGVDRTKKRKEVSKMKRMSKKKKTDVDLEEEDKLKTFLKIDLDEEGVIDYEFTMSNRHQELTSPEANGFCNEALAIPEKTATDSKVSDKYKAGLGYKEITPDNFVNSSEILEKQENRSDKGYHAVPPPFTGNYMPRNTIDVNHKGLFSTEEPKLVMKNDFSPPIIENWHSDDESEVESSPTVEGNPQQKEYKEKRVINNGCSRHMTGNNCYLTNFEFYDGGFVSFGDGKGRISGKVNPTIYVSCVKQFWSTVKVKNVNDQEQIQALVDKKTVIITEDNIRSDLRFDDAEGTACLLNEAIFEGLACMGAKTTAWNEFSSTMASAIICLADNQKFNFSKYIFDNMVKSLEGGVKFYLFPRFLQVFLDKQVEGMARHKKMYIISSHTNKIFANMRRIGVGFSRVITPLFDTMIVQAPADKGDTPVKTHQIPIVDQPSTSKPQKKQKHRRKQRKKVEVSHDESEDEDHVPTPSGDPLPSDEDSFILNELMVFCTNLQEQRKSRSRELRRLKKIGSEIALDDENQGRTNDDEIFGVNDLAREEVVMDTITSDHKEQIIEDISTAKPVTTAGEVVTTTTVKDSASPITVLTEDEITMAQALAALKSTKPKVVVQEQEMSTTIPAAATTFTTVVPTPRAKEQEAARLSRAQQDEKANNSWDNIQAMMDADRLLAERLQAREREEFSKVQKARLLIEKRKKYFAALRAQEKRNKPPTKTQMKSQMSTYLKHMDGYKQSHLKGRSLDEIKKLFDKDMINEGKKTYFKIIKADGSSQVYQTLKKMFKNFNKEDLEVLWAIVKDRFKKEKPMDDMDNLLFRTLKTMFEHHVEDTIWKYQQGLAKVKNWKLFESCGVYCITMQSTIYYLRVEKVYPLTRNTLHQLWSDVRLQVDHDGEMAYDLLRFIRKQLMEGYKSQ
nr:hypothetical protein [Tanacetum cinerariifolium]